MSKVQEARTSVPVSRSTDADAIFLSDLLVPLIRGWRLIAAVTALAIGVATAVSLWMPPKYEATAILAIVQPQGLAGQGLPVSLQIPAPSPSVLANVAKSDALLAAVARRLGKPASEELPHQVEAQADTSTNTLMITATAPSPAAAAALANALADALIEHVARVHRERLIAQLEAVIAQLDSEIIALEEEARRAPVTLEGVDLRLGPDVELSTVNPVWRELSVRAATARAHRQALEARRRELQANDIQDPAARAELAGVVSLAPAHDPARPAGPRVALNAALAGILGLMTGLFAVLAQQAWAQQIRPALPPRQPAR